MRNEKPALEAKKSLNEQAPVRSTEPKKKKTEKLPAPETTPVVNGQKPAVGAEPKKKKKEKLPDAAVPAPLKPAKTKPEKSDKTAAKAKEQKAPKDDKLTKFLVTMKKSARKSLKKEAAEVGVSMNEYIVSAVMEKLGKNS